uniref:malate dehydrogenase n=1 Tax=Saccharina japonica TaxID=88149 RepID=A0A097IUP6_SACJA|nr:malate dehydrogenase [Saccharina japonica]AIW62923.1 malate dehydrogenase 1 [Saccharina japonica]
MATLKVVVTGGAGQIAYSLVPLIARGLVFGPGVRVHLRLLDIPPAANALEGVAMEVQDSLFSTVLDGVLATTDEAQAFDGAQVAILLGGFPRRPGMERGDLIGKNASIMKRMGEALERYACHNCKVVVVANPAPTNCLVLSSHAPSLSRRNISCLSRLDHDRMVGMLLHEANRSLSAPVSAGGGDAGARGWRRLGPADVRGACVWGNHSNSQVPDASAVEFLIDGSWVPAVSVIGDSGWLDLSTSTPQGGRVLEGEVSGLAEAVRGRGAAVLGARKLSSAMSAANAIAGHLSDWLAPAAVSVSPSQAVSMGVTSDGNPFGVPEGLFCSFPVHCGGDGEWAFAEGYRLPEEAERQLEASIAELREEKSIVSEMLGEGAATEGSQTASYIASFVAPGHSSAAPVSSL